MNKFILDQQTVINPAIYEKVSTHRFVQNMREITEPLFKIGINYFSYCEYDIQRNQFFSLINNDDVGWYFVKNNGFNLEGGILNLQPGFYSLRSFQDLNPEQDNYFRGRLEVEKSIDSVSIVEHDKNNIARFYCYGLNNLKLYNYNYLETFNLYFREKAAHLITNSDRIIINTTPNADIPKQANAMLSINNPLNQNLNNFINDTDFYRYKLLLLATKYNLSQREAQCLDLITQNKLNKQIAYQLGLSARTIELYIINLRKKLACKNKLELLIKLYKS